MSSSLFNAPTDRADPRVVEIDLDRFEVRSTTSFPALVRAGAGDVVGGFGFYAARDGFEDVPTLTRLRLRASAFIDVRSGAHVGSILAIVDPGIAGGYLDGTFRPRANVTRAQMATFIADAVGHRYRCTSHQDDMCRRVQAPRF